MEKYFHDPYALANAQPEMTTMPTDTRQKILSPCQLVESFLLGGNAFDGTNRIPEVQTSDNRLMIMRNNSLIVSDVDMVSDRTMMARFPLSPGRVLILKTVGMTSVYEKFVTTYCERSPKVANILESPMCRTCPGVTTRDLIVRHFNQLVNNWNCDSIEYGMYCAKVFMFARDNWMPESMLSNEVRNAHFNTEDAEELKEDLRVYHAMKEIAR